MKTIRQHSYSIDAKEITLLRNNLMDRSTRIGVGPGSGSGPRSGSPFRGALVPFWYG